MLFVKFKDSEEIYRVEVLFLQNILRLTGDIPGNTSGFELSRSAENWDGWKYYDYKTIYRRGNGWIEFSSDGSIFCPTVLFTAGMGGSLVGIFKQQAELYENLEIPTPAAEDDHKFKKWSPEIPTQGQIGEDEVFEAVFEYSPSLDKLKADKIAEMNEAQQHLIHNGIDIELTDGTVEHFALKDHDQIDLMGLQSMATEGIEMIPWHSKDEAGNSLNCRFYSNEDMLLICRQALDFITFHVTYQINLENWIRDGIRSKRDLAKITYGTPIPEEYQGEVMAALYRQDAAEDE